MIYKDFFTYTKVSGATYKNDKDLDIQSILPLLKEEGRIYCIRDYSNEYDSNAIKVYYFTQHESIHIGYIKKELAAEIAPFLDEHPECDLDGAVEEVTGGNGNSYGCNIRIWITDPSEPSYEEIKAFQESLKQENKINSQQEKAKSSNNEPIYNKTTQQSSETSYSSVKQTKKSISHVKKIFIAIMCSLIALGAIISVLLLEYFYLSSSNGANSTNNTLQNETSQEAEEQYIEENPTVPTFTPTPNSSTVNSSEPKKEEPIVKISEIDIRYTILPPNSIGTVWMEGTYTNNSKYAINAFSVTVLLKDTNEKVYLSCYDTVLPGETSPIFDTFGPATQSPDDVEFLECNLRVIDETGDSKFIDYDYKLNSYELLG